MGTTTLVTALYDIGRGQMEKEANNHRPFSNYLVWFKSLLQVNAPLVIFIPPTGPESGNHDLVKFIREHRPSEYPTRVIVRPFSSLSLYSKRQNIKDVMTHLNHPDPRLEFHHPDYILIIYSKFNFLRDVINDNPFSSDYFFWIDAGYFREEPGKEVTFTWPDSEKIRITDYKFLIQNNSLHVTNNNPEKITNLTGAEKEYLRKCPNELLACFFGGNKKIVIPIVEKCLSLLDEMLSHNLVNNEQQVLSLLIYRHPDEFLIYPKGNNPRSLVSDLAVSGKLKVNHPTCPYLKALTVVSKEIKENDYKAWVDTVTYYGYNHEVLARNKTWGGWPFRTKEYLDALMSLDGKIQVVIISDGTDLFFCGSAWEAYHKFINSGQELVIGGENIIHYNSGRHDNYEMEEFFIKQCQSRFCFPNGGFVIGRVPALIRLLEANLDSEDDQSGYMDLYYEQKIRFILDEKNVFVGNLPNYAKYTKREVGFWKWDKNRRRYYNPITHEYPIALHFPGHNTGVQNRLLNEIISQNIETQNTNWAWLILIGVLLIFTIAIFWDFSLNCL